MSGSGSGGVKGEDWTGQLVVDRGQLYSFILTQNSLREELCKLESTNHAEQFRNIWLFKRPLEKGQYTQLFANHQFVVIKSTERYWSIEKNLDNLFLQDNQYFHMVVEYEQNKQPRNRPVVEIKHGKCEGTIKDLIEFLYCQNELEKKYNWIDENCKAFANRVFNEFAVPSTVYENWPWHLW